MKLFKTKKYKYSFHQLFKESAERNDSLLIRRDFVKLAAELQVERAEGVEQLAGVVVDVAEWHAVHREPVERDHAVWRVDHRVLQAEIRINYFTLGPNSKGMPKSLCFLIY